MDFKLLFNNSEYGYVVTFIFITFIFSLFLVIITILSSESSSTLFFKDKLSPYECGFIPYDDARAQFEIHFYIVALLFVIFDVELILLLPWVILGPSSVFSVCVFFIFFFILGLGFIYEWQRGALHWFFVNEQVITN